MLLITLFPQSSWIYTSCYIFFQLMISLTIAGWLQIVRYGRIG
jgi:hypothetical protein